MKEILRRIRARAVFLASALIKWFDVRDVYVGTGLWFIFHGLNLLTPWIAYTVVGIVLILLGLGLTSLIGKVRNGAPGRD